VPAKEKILFEHRETYIPTKFDAKITTPSWFSRVTFFLPPLGLPFKNANEKTLQYQFVFNFDKLYLIQIPVNWRAEYS
jgi:hypothetical protein